MYRKMLAVLSCALALFLCASPALGADELSFNESAVSLFEGERKTLTLNVAADLQGGEVTYKSSAPKVATVDASGAVTGVAKGAATVTATLKTAKKTYSAKVKVTVLKAVTSIAVSEDNLTVLAPSDGSRYEDAMTAARSLAGDRELAGDERLLILQRGKKTTIGAALRPTQASDRTFAVSSSDESVVSINKLSVTAVKEGVCVLTAASVSNPEVTQSFLTLVIEPVTKLTLDAPRTTVNTEGSVTVTAEFQPANATIRTVTWKSSNEKVATVDAEGNVTGVAKGQATIRATAADSSGKTASLTVTVTQLPESITLKTTELTLGVGKAQTLSATVLPSNANDKNVIWTSSDASVAKVNQEGRVTAVSIGTAEITAQSCANPDITATADVRVVQPVMALRISESKLELGVGDSAFVTLTVQPSDATEQSVTFSSDNARIATVDENGMITAVAKGQTTIRAKANDGSGKAASLSVTVAQMPEEITLNSTSLTVNTGKYKTIKATVLPANTNNKNVVWTSSDPSVAKVNSEGRVTGVKAGACVITCQSKVKGDVVAYADVTVTQLATKITFDQKSVDVNVTESAYVPWTVAPDDVTDSGVTFSSSNTRIATVDQSGVITAVKRGTATITAKAVDGSGTTGKLTVNVIQPVEGVHMKDANARVDVDESIRLTAVLEPSDASNTRMTWFSRDESIASIRGTNTRPTVTGHRWGSTVVYGITEDGGYQTTAYIDVGNYDTALRPTDLYLDNNAVKLAIRNVSNMNIIRIDFVVECYDIYGVPLTCSTNGANYFTGTYLYELGEGDTTRHGRFNFNGFAQPVDQIGRVVLRLTAYRADSGFRYYYDDNVQPTLEYTSGAYIGYYPVEEETEPDYTVTETDTLPDEGNVG